MLLAALLLSLALAPATLLAQGLTGQVSGNIQDPTGGAVPAARVTLTNAGTGQVRETAASPEGSFVFIQLLPGAYQLEVEAAGFKRFEQPGIAVTATERVVVRNIVLEMGQVTETLSVTADAARLQTQSAERSGLINTQQMQQLSLKGRDYLGMLRLLPGVVDTANRESPGFDSLKEINVNGARRATLNLTLDGVSNLDTGSMGGPFISPSLDAIGEVKVLLSNYQAEYGRSSGGTINAVIKNGTREFHGMAYYFKRNEALNANEYFNNRDGLPRPRYRFDYPGYNIGGPLLIPGVNRSREKLFFFWSQEFLPRKEPQAQRRRTFPTAAEREGDFSNTLDTNGRLIPIQDPLNNRQPFAGNVVPRNRIDPNGQGLLKIFPLPNTVDPRNTFNNVFQPILDHPRREEILRVDWIVGPRTTFYARGILNAEAFKGSMVTQLGARDWEQFPTDYNINGRGLVATLIHTFSPTLVNEFTFGVNRGVQTIKPQSQEALDRNNRVKLGLNLPQFFPQSNPLNLVPNASFGGVQSAPRLDIENRFPFSGTNNIYNWSNNISKIAGRHNIKVGFYFEKTARNGDRTATATGFFDFGRNVNNPYDTNYAFSNALLGSINNYSESDHRPYSYGRFWNQEWYAQDNWRVTRRLTLDIGVRFYRILPTYNGRGQLAAFAPELFRAADAPRLIEPYLNPTTRARVGRNPLTGELLPAVLIGAYAPGSGNIYNGILVADNRIMETPSIQVAPRVGFALDVFGNGKTAIRGGFGIFPDRLTDTTSLQLVQQPPLVNTPIAYYTTISQLLATPLNRAPGTVVGVERSFSPQTAYNWSFGVQQDIGFSTMVDVAYVGSVGRHLQQTRNLNATPYGTNFLPSSIDPTLTGNRPLPANFLRPLRGYADVRYLEFSGTSNYHSLQAQVNKRFGRGLTFGSSWTWSKAMGVGDTEGSALNPYLDARMRNYGKLGYDRTHNLVIHYAYTLPKLSTRWNNAVSRLAGDNWEISGINSFISGRPLGIGYGFVQAVDITGATGLGIDSRVELTGDPNLPRGERSALRHFRTEVVRPPSAANFGIGTAAKDLIRGPGTNNWDFSVFKNFPLGAEQRRLQFRFEMYNAFNHTQFSGVDTTARFDPQGRQVNARMGEYTSTALARRIQLGLKFYF